MNRSVLKAHKTVMFILVLCLMVLPLLVTKPYSQHLLIMFLWTASTAIAWNIIGGYGGQLSIGHAIFLGIGAYSSAVLQVKFDIIPIVGTALGVILSMVFAFVVFYPCFRLRGPYFTMATIAMTLTMMNLFLNFEFVGKAEGILAPFKDVPNLLWFQFLGKLPFYYLILLVFIGFIFLTRMMEKSRLGYSLKAIKQNEFTAVSIGINNPMEKAKAVVLSAGMMSILGSFYFQYVRYIDPEIFLVPNSVDIILPAIIGGLGTISGPILGTIIIFPLTEFLRGTIGSVLSGSHYIIIAIIMVVVVLLKPEGINRFFVSRYYRLLAWIVGRIGTHPRKR